MSEVAALDVLIRSTSIGTGFASAATEARAMSGELQTVAAFTTNYGGALTAQEMRYASLQLKSSELRTAEADLVSEGGNLARAFGSVGDSGERAFSRIGAAFGSVSGAGGMGLALGGVLVVGGALLELGKSSIDNADAQEAATKSLTQAYEAQGLVLAQNGGWIDDFIHKNAAYIDNIYSAQQGIAQLTRAGNDQATVQRLMNDALDLAAVKNISLSDAVNTLNDAEHGRLRGLIDLGITTTKYTDQNGNLIQSQHSVAQSMAEVEARIKGGKEALDEHKQSTDRLTTAWDIYTAHLGTQALPAIDAMKNKTADLITVLDNNRTAIGAALGTLEHYTLGLDGAAQAIGRIIDGLKWLDQNKDHKVSVTVATGGGGALGGASVAGGNADASSLFSP